MRPRSVAHALLFLLCCTLQPGCSHEGQAVTHCGHLHGCPAERAITLYQPWRVPSYGRHIMPGRDQQMKSPLASPRLDSTVRTIEVNFPEHARTTVVPGRTDPAPATGRTERQ